VTPAFELLFYLNDRSFVALVYDIDPKLSVRDVTIFELLKYGKFRYIGVGVFAKKFVPVGTFPKILRPMVNAVLQDHVK
jgi:hypothetical protein